MHMRALTVKHIIIYDMFLLISGDKEKYKLQIHIFMLKNLHSKISDSYSLRSFLMFLFGFFTKIKKNGIFGGSGYYFNYIVVGSNDCIENI